MAKPHRSAPCGATDARARLHTAEAYLETAELAHDEARDGFANVTAGLAVLAGIAASDAICCVRLGRLNRGEDHQSAIILLEGATPDGKKLGTTLGRLLGLKDAAHYGASLVSARSSSDAIRWARGLVDRAREETER